MGNDARFGDRKAGSREWGSADRKQDARTKKHSLHESAIHDSVESDRWRTCNEHGPCDHCAEQQDYEDYEMHLREPTQEQARLESRKRRKTTPKKHVHEWQEVSRTTYSGSVGMITYRCNVCQRKRREFTTGKAT